MSELAAVVLAAAVALGAHVGGGPSPLVGVALAAVAVAARRPWLLCLAGALLAAGLAERARAGLDPVAAGPVDGWATLASDPEPMDGGGVRVLVDVDGSRVEASAHGPPSWALEPRLAGERVLLRGRLRPPPLPLSAWAQQRRVVGRLDVDEVVDHARGSPLATATNTLRRAIERGADDLGLRARSLLAGVVLGDDRHQPPELADDFRAAGLTHLTAVSGQNLAFVLILARPVLAWFPGRGRVVATLALLGAFAALVRFEPSVLRAGAMAAVACLAGALGRPAERIRILALAVSAVLLVDPLLVGSLGFGLSVGASLGIVVLAPRLTTALPGPRAFAEALAVTIAAQAGALPVLLPAFGSVPVATVPANLLAVPAAGPLMMWGLTGGVAAGVVGDPLPGLLHLPTAAITWWLATVASAGARLPLGELRAGHLAAVAVGLAVVVLCRRRSRAAVVVGAAVAAGALAAAALSVPTVGQGTTDVVAGVRTHRTGDQIVVEVGRGARVDDALEALRRVGARCGDAVVVPAGAGAGARRAAAALARRCPGMPVAAAAGEALPGWIVVPAGARVGVGSPGHGGTGHDAAPRGPPLRHHPPRRRHGDPEPHPGLVLRQGDLLRVRRLPAQGRAARRRRR